MTALAHRRARVARVRHVQHLQAAGAAAAAEGRVAQLETNVVRLHAVRAGLDGGVGATSGAALGNLAELGGRLDAAREGLGRAIHSARDVATLAQAARLAADLRREGAERLAERAVADLQRRIETRLAAALVVRPARSAGDD